MSRATLIGAVAVVLAAGALVAPGYGRYVITSGSMGGALPTGALAYDRPVDAADVRVGDVVTFARPDAPSQRVTHRVVARDGDVLRTRGDANPVADPWRLGPGTRLQRVRFHVPYAGYAVAALRLPQLWIALLAACALLGLMRAGRRREVTA
jgi:signal peptidase